MKKENNILTLGDLTKIADLPIYTLIDRLYKIALVEPYLDPYAIINKGCNASDIEMCESIINVELHPLHKFLLSICNGGTIPFVNSISIFGAASREIEKWRILEYPLAKNHDPGFISSRMVQEVSPVLIDQIYMEDEIPQDLVIFAFGYGEQYWGYKRNSSGQIDCFMPNIGRFVAASSFEEFLQDQLLYNICSRKDFIDMLL